MIKQAPTSARSPRWPRSCCRCFGLLMMLWLRSAGSMPLKPEGYRFKATFNEAALLVEQADVRIAGLNVGKVVEKELARRPDASRRSSSTRATRRSRATRA